MGFFTTTKMIVVDENTVASLKRQRCVSTQVPGPMCTLREMKFFVLSFTGYSFKSLGRCTYSGNRSRSFSDVWLLCVRGLETWIRHRTVSSTTAHLFSGTSRAEGVWIFHPSVEDFTSSRFAVFDGGGTRRPLIARAYGPVGTGDKTGEITFFQLFMSRRIRDNITIRVPRPWVPQSSWSYLLVSHSDQHVHHETIWLRA